MVSDDIVTRLRDENSQFDFFDWNDAEKLMSEAADEIERLRAELQSYYEEDEEIRRGRSGE